jgi:lipopolysaccharide transport system permease protein
MGVQTLLERERLPQAGSSAPAPTPAFIIKPKKGWQGLEFGEVWRYRELLWFLTVRDIKGRYRQMALGPLWLTIRPVLNMIVYSVVFGGIAKLPSDGLPYPILTFSALLPWMFFATAVTSASQSLMNQTSVISKVYFPRLVIPIAAIFSGLVDFVCSAFVLLGMMIYYGFVPTLGALVLPFFVLIAAAFALGLGLWTATLTVRFRDLQFVVAFLISAGLYATPVAYAASAFPAKWLTLLKLNPMFWVVEGFRWSLLGHGTAPQPFMLISVAGVALILVTGAYVFRRSERNLVDLL